MSEVLKEAFGNAVRHFAEIPIQVYPATVKAVSELTCTVVLNEGTVEFDDVRLRGFDDDEDGGLIIFPKVGSSCLVGVVDGEFGEFYLVQASQVQGFSYKEDDTEIRFDKDGALLKRAGVQVVVGEDVTVKTAGAEVKVGDKLQLKAGGVNLKDVLDELVGYFSEAKAMVTSPGTPAPLDPATIGKSTVLKTKVSQLLQ